MPEALQSASCLLCGGNDVRVVAGRPDSPRRIVKCRNDGLVYLNPRPSLSEVINFHEGAFVRKDNAENFAPFRGEILHREAEVVRRYKPEGGALLDVGCATGVFFNYFPEPKWRLYGLDLSNLGTQLTERLGRAEVFRGTLTSANYPSDFFDVVTILDTLYYSPNPLEELRETVRILRPNGIVAVEVPGLSYTLIRSKPPLSLLLDRRWCSLSASSNHLFYFSSRDITRLLERAGMELVETVPEQASLGRGSLWRVANNAHFALARGLFKVTGGRFSIAGKELYIARRNRVAR